MYRYKKIINYWTESRKGWRDFLCRCIAGTMGERERVAHIH